MDAINESIWESIQENADSRSGWVSMRGLYQSLSEWALDGGQVNNEFRELEAYGLIIALPGIGDEGIQLLIRKERWFCPNCKLVAELPSEHAAPCMRKERKKAGWRVGLGD